MEYPPSLLVSGAVFVASLAVGFVLWRLRRRLRAYVDKVSACGYIHTRPTWSATMFLRAFSRFCAFIQVGKIRVIGGENLDISGPVLVTPNHPSWVDPAVAVLTLKRPARFLAARRFFRFCFGLPSLIAARCGAISVDLRRGKGRPAHDASVEVLRRGETLVMFPEGYAYLDSKLGPFRKGATRIAREAAGKLGRPVAIIPMCIRYGRSPGSWIRKWNEPTQYFWTLLNAWYYRRGATVVIGKPISSADLPQGDTEAADFLAAAIARLDPIGQMKALPSGVGLPYPSDTQE